jgi:PAS domain S-box-containing protein
VVLRDISERVEAEKQIREREAEYRSIFEATNDGMVIADMEGYIVGVNPAFCRMYGYTRDELIGLHTTELADPDYRHTIAASLEAERAGGTYQTVAKALRKNGTTFHADGRGTSFMYRGKLHALGIVQDVTERVRAYELLEQRVEERTRELSTLLDVSHNVSSTLELRPLLELILDQLKGVVQYAGAAIMLIDGDEAEIVAFRGPGGGVLAPGVRIPLDRMDALSKAWRAGPFIIDDVRGDSPAAVAYRRGEAEYQDASDRYVRSYMSVPLLLGERLIGHLGVSHAEPHAFTPHHTELAMALAQQVTIAIENARLYEQATERTRELSTLLEVSHNVSSTLELKPLLDLILDQIAGVVEYAGASISLIDGDESEIVAYRGLGSASVAVGLRVPVDRMDPGPQSWRSGPLVIDDVRANTPEALTYRRNESELLDSSFAYVRSWMAVPLIVNERLVGVLTLNGAQPNLYTPHHAELVLGIASQAAIAIENARLYEQAQELAALEERQRLARELHDSVSQALFGIGLGARTARALLERDVDKAAQSIDYVLSLTQGGMAEMRALIFELRPESLETEGLVQALTKQADAVRARYEVPISPTLCDEPAVPLPVKEALYRIAQEALHNAVKHAQPRSVAVSLEYEEGEVVLEIRDDGQGFDTGGSFPGHLGLHSMRERAERVGGTLEVESRIAEGTRVRVRVPARSDK